MHGLYRVLCHVQLQTDLKLVFETEASLVLIAGGFHLICISTLNLVAFSSQGRLAPARVPRSETSGLYIMAYFISRLRLLFAEPPYISQCLLSTFALFTMPAGKTRTHPSQPFHCLETPCRFWMLVCHAVISINNQLSIQVFPDILRKASMCIYMTCTWYKRNTARRTRDQYQHLRTVWKYEYHQMC